MADQVVVVGVSCITFHGRNLKVAHRSQMDALIRLLIRAGQGGSGAMGARSGGMRLN